MSWRERIGVGAALAALIAVSFVVRWHVLAASPYPLGVDGFFYPLQVRALLDHGALAYPPLTYVWMAPFAAVTDPITGAKLGAALGGALIALPAYGVGARLGRSAGAGLVAAVLAALSAGSAYLSIEFVKQGVGLTVALAAVWLVLRACETPSRGRMIAACTGAVATLLAHKLAAGVLVVVALPAIAAEMRVRLRGRRLIYATLGGIVTAIALVIVAIELTPAGHLFAPARWDLPALATRSFVLRMEDEPRIAAVVAVLAALALASGRIVAAARRIPALARAVAFTRERLAAAAARIRALARVAPFERERLVVQRSAAERAAAWVCVVLAIAIALPWLDVGDPQGLAFRLRIAAFVPLALCAAVVCSLIPRQLLPILALVLAIRGAHERTEGQVLAHPALVAGAMAVHVPTGTTVIVPERHIAFMVAYYARVPVALRPEAVPHDQRMRLVPLHFIGTGSEIEHAIDNARAQPGLVAPLGLHPRYRNGLVLIAEPTWDWILAQLPEGDRRYYARWPTI